MGVMKIMESTTRSEVLTGMSIVLNHYGIMVDVKPLLEKGNTV